MCAALAELVRSGKAAKELSTMASRKEDDYSQIDKMRVLRKEDSLPPSPRQRSVHFDAELEEAGLHAQYQYKPRGNPFEEDTLQLILLDDDSLVALTPPLSSTRTFPDSQLLAAGSATPIPVGVD